MEQGFPFMGCCPDEQVQLASPVILFLGNDDGIGLVREEFLCPVFDLAEFNSETLVKFRQKGLKLLTTDCIISFVFYTMFTKRWIILWKNEKN